MFHKHNWVISKTTYASPVNLGLKGVSQELGQRLLFGLTTFLWECSICKKLRKEEMLGSENNNRQS